MGEEGRREGWKWEVASGKWEVVKRRTGEGGKEGKESGLVWGKDSNTCRWVQIGRMCGFVLGGRKGSGEEVLKAVGKKMKKQTCVYVRYEAWGLVEACIWCLHFELYTTH